LKKEGPAKVLLLGGDIDASGRLDRKEEVRRLFQDAQVPAICIVHPDCADQERYCSEFPVYGYAVPGSGGPLLSAAIRTALRLAGSPGPGAVPQHPALCGREGEKLFRTFMTNLPVYVFIKDQEGRYIFANEAYRRLGKTDYELFPPEVAKQITENDEKARRSSEPLETVEEVPYAKTVQTHLVVKFLITPEDPKAPLLGGIAFDITELVKTLEEKSALLKELQHRVKNSLVMIASLIGIEVKVSDDGIGLPSDFSIEKAGGSGMLLSKVLAEQLGGTFRFEQNDRTVFILDVPLSG
jgi:two-component sensor histidine kinase